VAQVEVDEVLGLVGDEGAEVTSNNAVPGWSLALIKLERRSAVGSSIRRAWSLTHGLLDVLSNILLRGPLAMKRVGRRNTSTFSTVYLDIPSCAVETISYRGLLIRVACGVL